MPPYLQSSTIAEGVLHEGARLEVAQEGISQGLVVLLDRHAPGDRVDLVLLGEGVDLELEDQVVEALGLELRGQGADLVEGRAGQGQAWPFASAAARRRAELSFVAATRTEPEPFTASAARARAAGSPERRTSGRFVDLPGLPRQGREIGWIRAPLRHRDHVDDGAYADPDQRIVAAILRSASMVPPPSVVAYVHREAPLVDERLLVAVEDRLPPELDLALRARSRSTSLAARWPRPARAWPRPTRRGTPTARLLARPASWRRPGRYWSRTPCSSSWAGVSVSADPVSAMSYSFLSMRRLSIALPKRPWRPRDCT